MRDESVSSSSYGQVRPVGGHGVVAGDGADRDRVAVGALVALHADAADDGQDGEALPQLAVEARLADLLLDDRVRALQHVDALARDLADDADGEAGTREGLPPDDVLGQPQLLAHGADFVLEEPAQRLDQLEVHLLGQAADVVVALDLGGLARAALDDVAVERALDEELGVGELARLLLEAADELLADDLALALGLGDALELAEEPVAGVDRRRAGCRTCRRRSRPRGRPRACASCPGRRTRR